MLICVTLDEVFTQEPHKEPLQGYVKPSQMNRFLGGP